MMDDPPNVSEGGVFEMDVDDEDRRLMPPPSYFRVPGGQVTINQHRIRGQMVFQENEPANDCKEPHPGSKKHKSDDSTTLAIRLLPVDQFNSNVQDPDRSFQEQQKRQLLPFACVRTTSIIGRSATISVHRDAVHDNQKGTISSPISAFSDLTLPRRWSDVDVSKRSVLIRRCKRSALHQAMQEGKITLEQIESVPLDWQTIALDLYEERGLINLPEDFERISTSNPLLKSRNKGRERSFSAASSDISSKDHDLTFPPTSPCSSNTTSSSSISTKNHGVKWIYRASSDMLDGDVDREGEAEYPKR